MGDILGIVVLIFIYLLAAQAKKKKSGASGKQPSRAQKTAAAKRSEEAQKGFSAAFAGVQKPSAGAKKSERPQIGRTEGADRPGVHLHSVTAQQMEAAGEGEDPCHAGHALPYGADDSPVYDSPFDRQTPDESEWAQQMISGVIMSEILTRPCERRARRGA